MLAASGTEHYSELLKPFGVEGIGYRRMGGNGAVILRCAPLRASKDGRKDCAEQHPSRLAQEGSHLRMTPRKEARIVGL